MGRVKLKIKKLESTSNRQVTYSKRRNGILKKAKELSILCDIDIILLMFSPTGKPTLFHGERSHIEDVIAKFSQITPQERAKRKLESLETLKKTFKKLDHEVNIQEILGMSTQTVEGLTDEVRLMQSQLIKVQKRLSSENIDDIEQVRQMEESLKESIIRIRLHKECFGRCQSMPLECNSQNAMPFSLVNNDMQEIAQPLSWLPNKDNHNLSSSNNPCFFPQRDVECYDNASLPIYAGYFLTSKQHEMGNSRSIDTIRQESGVLSDLSSSGCLPLPLNEQFTCLPSYSSMNFSAIKKMIPMVTDINLQGNHGAYQVNNNFELPRLVDESRQHSWIAASVPCGDNMFGENSYHQQPN